MNTNCIIVPAEALETPDYSGPVPEGGSRQTIKPEAGDPVTFTVKGTVQSLEEGRARVHIAFIDGKRVDDAAATPPPAEDEGIRIRVRAEKIDNGE